MTELKKLIDSTIVIGTVPRTLTEVQEVMADPEASTENLADIVGRDPAIAARVLQLVNSPSYAQSDHIATVDAACVVLGFKVIENLVIQATVLGEYAVVAGADGFDPVKLWDHSFKAAQAARGLSEALPDRFGVLPDVAYTCGLLHDVGKVMLLQGQPSRFREALMHSRTTGIPLSHAERDVFGFTDAQACGHLAARWRLGDQIEASVLRHHDEEAEPEHSALGTLVHISSAIAHDASGPADSGWVPDLAHQETIDELGLSPDELDDIRDRVRNTLPQCA